MLDPFVGAGITVARLKDRDGRCRMHLQRVSEWQSIRNKRGATGGKEAVPAEVLLGNERQWFGAALCTVMRRVWVWLERNGNFNHRHKMARGGYKSECHRWCCVSHPQP